MAEIKHNDQQTQDKFFNYTKLGLIEWQENNRQKLNSIIDEISNPSKESPKIRVWGKVLLKCLLEFQKNPSIFQHIVNIVLRKIPWFDSPNHLMCFDIFEKLIMNIISLNPNHILQVFKVLIENLVPKSILEREQTIDITINKYKFSSQVELIDFIKEMLGKESYSQELAVNGQGQAQLSLQDEWFCRELIKFHPCYEEKTEKMVKVVLGVNQNYVVKSRCLMVVREEGSLQDISYIKSVQGIVNKANYEKRKNQPLLYTGGDLSLELLAKILKMNPISRKQFSQLFKDLFPHKKRNIQLLRSVFQQSLKLTLRCKEVLKIVIEVVIQSLLTIDSEVAAQKEVKKAVHQCIYQEMPQKLEALLEIVYEYLNYVFIQSPSNPFHSKKHPFKASLYLPDLSKGLLLIFQEQLLVAQRVKYVQNIYFYIGLFYDQYPDFYQKTITLLVLNSQDQKLSKVVRTNSIFFLEGFITQMMGQGQQDMLFKCLQHLINNLQDYSIKYNSQLIFSPDRWDCYSILSSSTANHELAILGNKHLIFFSLAQALLSILFYHPDHFLSHPEHYNTLLSIIQSHQELFFIYINTSLLHSLYSLFNQPEIKTSMPALNQVIQRWKDQHKNKRSTNKITKYKLDYYQPFSPIAAKQLIQAHLQAIDIKHQDNSIIQNNNNIYENESNHKVINTPVSQGDTDSSQLQESSKLN